VADLIHELKVQFPTATITHNGGVRWIGGIVYVDDLCLISTDARELQMMTKTCQKWSEKARMQLSADKTKIMCFHIAPKRDYEALYKHPTVATRATNPHAASLARRPGTMKVHELRILDRHDADRGAHKRRAGGQRTGRHQNYVKPHKHEMRDNDHEKFMVTLFGLRHSTFYPFTQTTPTSRRGLTVTQDTYPHSYKRLNNLTISVSNLTPW